MALTWDIRDDGFGASGYEDVFCSVHLISHRQLFRASERCMTFDVLYMILWGERGKEGAGKI